MILPISSPPHFGPGEVRAGQRGIVEVRIGEVGLAEIGIGQRGAESRIREVGLAEVRVGQRGVIEVRIREVLAGEVHAGKIVAAQADSGQIVGLVAGRRVELRSRDPSVNEVRPSHFGPGEVRASQRGAIEVRIGEVLAWLRVRAGQELLNPKSAFRSNRGPGEVAPSDRAKVAGQCGQ